MSQAWVNYYCSCKIYLNGGTLHGENPVLNVTELPTKRSPEVRKQIRDFEGYEIDEMGNVYCTRYEKERVIHPWVEINTGYRLVRIRKNKKTVCLRVHRLVAEAFLPNPDNLPYVKHKGDNREDNSVYNLEWGDCPDNTQEGYDNNCYAFHTRCHGVKATNKITGEVFHFKSLRCCADTLGLDRKRISAILKRGAPNNYDYEFCYEMPND